MRKILFILAVLLGSFALAPAANATGVFLELCGPPVKVEASDPFILWNQTPSAHEHQVFGNKAWAYNATVPQMLAGATSCQAPSDKVSFWTPTIKTPMGQTVVATKSTYDLRVDDLADGSVPVVAPEGFGYIAGNPHGTTGSNALWKCAGAPSNTQKFSIPTNCDAYGNIGVQAAQYATNANPCWDTVNVGPGFGRNTGPADGQDHINNAVNGLCPAPNKRVIGNGWHFTFPPAAIGGRLSSDSSLATPGASWHTDHIQFNRAFVQAIYTDCLLEAVPEATVTCVTRSDGHVYRKRDNKLVV